MKTLLLAPTVVLALSLGPAHPSCETELRFTPKAGLKITRTWTNPSERDLKDMSLTLKGESHAGKGMDMHTDFEEKLVVTDELVSVKSGRPTKIKRTFEEIESKRTEKTSSKKGENQHDEERQSDLAHTTVLFTWDAEKEEYAAAFEEKDKDEDLLSGLEADMDLTGLLPEKAVSKDAEWTIDAAAFKSAILRPGGDLSLHTEDGKDDATEKETRKKVWEALKGDVHLKFGGTREADGTSLGVIQIKAELTSEVELDGPPDKPSLKSLNLSLSHTFEGEILWDLQKGLAHSLKIESQGTLSYVTHLEFEAGGETLDGVQEMVFDEKGTYEAAFEVTE